MRFSSFAVLSSLAAIAIVNALPVEDWKPKHNVTSSAPASTPTPPVICCASPGVPTLCTECRSHSVAPTAYRSAPTSHHHHNVTTSVAATPTAPIVPHNVSLSTRIDKSAYQLAQQHPDQFLSQYVFENLLVDEFKFGKGKSSNVGANMISQYIVVPAHTQSGSLKPVPGGNQLAIHLNSMVTASALQNNAITINVQQFHLTARSITTQKKIDASGPSAATAAQSIHIGVNTEWGRAENLKALAQEINISTDQTLKEVQEKQGFNNPYVVYLVKQFRTKVEQRIHQLLGGNVAVKWQGDKTFPTQ